MAHPHMSTSPCPPPLSPCLLVEIEALERLPDDSIDLSDMPEVTDWSGAIIGAFARRVPKPAVIDADILDWFRRHSDNPQVMINAVLREYVSGQR